MALKIKNMLKNPKYQHFNKFIIKGKKQKCK